MSSRPPLTAPSRWNPSHWHSLIIVGSLFLLLSSANRCLLAATHSGVGFAQNHLTALSSAASQSDDTPLERLLTTRAHPDIQLARLSPREPPLRLNFPGSAYTAGISSGKAIVGVMLDESGKPTDYLLLAYTQDYFGRDLLRQARELAYDPLIIRGLAVPSRYQLGYRFVPDLAVILNGNQAVSAWRIESSDAPFIYRPYQESELDQTLELVQLAQPRLPKNFPANDPSQIQVMVSFYVDETGQVRLPNIDDTPSGELVRRAIKAALQWKFRPPTVKGKPVLAYAAREINFAASSP